MKKILLFFALLLVFASSVNAIDFTFDKSNKVYSMNNLVNVTISGCTENDVATLIVSSQEAVLGNNVLWIDQISYSSAVNSFLFKINSAFAENKFYNIKAGCSGSTKDDSFCVGSCPTGSVTPPAPGGSPSGPSSSNNRRNTDNSVPTLYTSQTDLNDNESTDNFTGQQGTNENYADEGKTNYLVWIIFFIVILIIIGIGIFFVVKYWNKGKSEKVSIAMQEDDKLGNYIKKAIANGESKEEIKKNLIKVGWPEDTVDNALKNY